jgi:hypothetical protein
MPTAALAVSAVLLATVLADAAPVPRLRSLQGVASDTAVEASADVAGTVGGVDRRTGAVTVRAADAILGFTVPPTTAAALRPGEPVTVGVLLVRLPPAPGTPGGGPEPANPNPPDREVHRPAGSDPRTHPDMVDPRPER